MMSHYSKCLLPAVAILLLGFSPTPCRAQDEGQLLHSGLLGYTAGTGNPLRAAKRPGTSDFCIRGAALIAYLAETPRGD